MTFTPFANVANNISSVITGALDGSTTQIGVTPGTGALFPAAPFYASVEFEVVKVLAIAGDVLTVSRGQDLTSPAAHPAGSIIEMRGNAALWKEIQSAVNKIENGTTPVPINPPAGSITDVMLASDVNRPNLLHNPGFEMLQDAVASLSPTAGGAIDGDYWLLAIGAPSTATIGREIVNIDLNSKYSVIVTYSHNSSGSAVVQQGLLNPPLTIEALRGQEITFSARVKTSTANMVRVGIWDTVNSWRYSSVYHPGNGNWVTLTFTATIPAGATNCVVGTGFANTSGIAYIDNCTLTFGPTAAKYMPAVKDLPDALPDAHLGIDVARYNFLTNGGFEVWQRGPGPFVPPAAYAADRWQIWSASGSGISVSQDYANSDNTISKCAAVTTTAPVAPGNGAQLYQYPIVENDVLGRQLGGKWVCFTVRVKTSVAGGCYLSLQVSDGLSTARFSRYHSGSGAYETLYVAAPLVGNISGILGSFGIMFEKPGTFYVDNASVVLGTRPSLYVPMHPADELARCLRYYERLESPAGTALIIGGQCISTIQGVFGWNYKAFKCAAPSLTASPPSWMAMSGASNNQLVLNGISAAANHIDKSFWLASTASGLVAGDATALNANATTCALIAEANPA